MVANQRKAPKSTIRIEVELLALDLDACSRCAGTAANVRAVVNLARELFCELGTEVVYRETVVGSADQAERLRFASSPTVRVNGRDVARENAATHDAKCCDEQACCDPADKAACCGGDDESPTCGCQ